jgi:protein farnesyltransferase/geranylgeranyltransferase type-1 subunit alpha|tara:strand:- start:7431 stop:8009 length:579 start_codon:yes stop_codon:yes gene_type:complete
MPRSAPKEQRAGSDSDDEDLCLAYSKRVGWKDVIPIAQPETANPIVSIDYRPEYVDVMNYFRAVFVSGEVSRRVLDLTADAIAMNGANYTVWHRRWEVVEAMVEMERNGERSGGEMSNGGGGEMSVDDAMDDDNDTSNPSLLDHEFAYTAKLCLANPKNYQVWNHMRLVSAALGAKSSARNLAGTCYAFPKS